MRTRRYNFRVDSPNLNVKNEELEIGLIILKAKDSLLVISCV